MTKSCEVGKFVVKIGASLEDIKIVDLSSVDVNGVTLGMSYDFASWVQGFISFYYYAYFLRFVP
jgi:hypothetical protein